MDNLKITTGKLTEVNSKIASYLKELNEIQEKSRFLTAKLLWAWQLRDELTNSSETSSLCDFGTNEE